MRLAGFVIMRNPVLVGEVNPSSLTPNSCMAAGADRNGAWFEALMAIHDASGW